MRRWRIEKATQEHNEILLHHRVEMFRSMGWTTQQLDSIEHAMRIFFNDNEMDEINAYVAILENEIVGGIVASFYQMLPNDTNPTGIVGYLYNLFVEPQYRKMGIATGLLETALLLCRQKNTGKIALHATDLGLGIYLKLGFEKRENYYEMNL